AARPSTNTCAPTPQPLADQRQRDRVYFLAASLTTDRLPASLSARRSAPDLAPSRQLLVGGVRRVARIVCHIRPETLDKQERLSAHAPRYGRTLRRPRHCCHPRCGLV